MNNSKRKQWEIIDKNKTYFSFIESCHFKKYSPENCQLHMHHIIPKYAFSETSEDIAEKNCSENLILLSLEDHIKAHELLYDVFKNPQDLGAIAILKGSQSEACRIWRQLGAKATHQIQKEKYQTFYNSDFQKNMAKRSLARPDALEIRSKGGKIGGTKCHLDRAIKAHQCFVFSYQSKEVLCIFNCRTGGQVLEQLNQYKKTSLQRVTPLIKGVRQSLNGWSCYQYPSCE